MWEQIALNAHGEGRAQWDVLTREEQATIISSWTDSCGRVEMLIDCPVDIIGLVASMYVASDSADRMREMANLGKAICATYAVAARKSVESFWRRIK